MTAAEIAESRALVEVVRSHLPSALLAKPRYRGAVDEESSVHGVISDLREICKYLTRSLNQNAADEETIKELRGKLAQWDDYARGGIELFESCGEHKINEKAERDD